MESPKAAFIHCSELEQFPYPAGCPFNTSRAGQVYQTIKSMGILGGSHAKLVEPKPADRIVLKTYHTPRYLHTLKRAARKENFDPAAYEMGIGTPDCPIFKGMYEYSAWACGATLKGVELILGHKADIAFNPSGGLHHAFPERAAGFCYMNDVALACLVLADAGRRVLYLDIDVHHGDGVAACFYDRSDVMTISTHETGRMLFPGTGFEEEIGSGEGKGYCVNIPLPVGTYDDAFLNVFNQVIVPLIDAYEPDVFVFELGADGLAQDPLAHLKLTNNVYAEVIKSLMGFDVPIVATGGGGYNIENTVRAWSLAWSLFCDGEKYQDMSVGMGGVMLESTDWQGGLKDHQLPVTQQQKKMVDPVIEKTIHRIKSTVFPIHGLT